MSEFCGFLNREVVVDEDDKYAVTDGVIVTNRRLGIKLMQQGFQPSSIYCVSCGLYINDENGCGLDYCTLEFEF